MNLKSVILKWSLKEKLQHLQHLYSHVPPFSQCQARFATSWYSHNISRACACLPPFWIYHSTPLLWFCSRPSIATARTSTFPSYSSAPGNTFLADPALQTHLQTHTQSAFYKSNPLGLFSSHTVSIFFLSFVFSFFNYYYYLVCKAICWGNRSFPPIA